MRTAVYALALFISLCATAAWGNVPPGPLPPPPSSKPADGVKDNNLLIGGLALTGVLVGGGLVLARRTSKR